MQLHLGVIYNTSALLQTTVSLIDLGRKSATAIWKYRRIDDLWQNKGTDCKDGHLSQAQKARRSTDMGISGRPTSIE